MMGARSVVVSMPDKESIGLLYNTNAVFVSPVPCAIIPSR